MRFLLLALMVLAGCDEKGIALSGDELAALFEVDQRIAFEGYRFTGTAKIHSDKSFDVSIPALGKDKGGWWLVDDKICSRWEQVRKGEELCAVIAKRSDGSFVGRTPTAGITLGSFRLIE